MNRGEDAPDRVIVYENDEGFDFRKIATIFFFILLSVRIWSKTLVNIDYGDWAPVAFPAYIAICIVLLGVLITNAACYEYELITIDFKNRVAERFARSSFCRKQTHRKPLPDFTDVEVWQQPKGLKAWGIALKQTDGLFMPIAYGIRTEAEVMAVREKILARWALEIERDAAGVELSDR